MTAVKKIQFYPVAILRNGVLLQDGHMVYVDKRNRWLYVSEDGQSVVMYSSIADLIKELYRRNSDDDFVVTGWDMYPTRFDTFIDSAYNYYNARFE